MFGFASSSNSGVNEATYNKKTMKMTSTNQVTPIPISNELTQTAHMIDQAIAKNKKMHIKNDG